MKHPDWYEFDRFTLHGRTFTAFTVYDDTGDMPWEREDGHGPVSKWRPKDSKAPGEMVLCEDRGQARFYDFAAAVKLARKDGWDTKPYGTRKPGERAHAAAMADFERLRRFCAGDWGYIGVIVEDARGRQASLWGIESDSHDYHKEVARELADEMIVQAREERRRAELKHCLLGEVPA